MHIHPENKFILNRYHDIVIKFSIPYSGQDMPIDFQAEFNKLKSAI